MGSPFTIIAYGDGTQFVDSVVEKVFDEVDRLSAIFSDYIDSSELNKLGNSSGSNSFVPVSEDLFDILRLSKGASELSGGAFDISVGPLSRLWRTAIKTNNFPAKDKIIDAQKKVGYENIFLDVNCREVKLIRKSMALDLGGIAKGYIAQRALDMLKNAGLSSSLVNAGGDMAFGDPPPDKDGWTIGISLLDSANKLMGNHLITSNRAVATSGDSFRHLDYNGKRYSHIIDPRTGEGVTYHRNLTVVADNGATADWVASACSVMDITGVKRMLSSMPQVAVMIIQRSGTELSQAFFNGFQRYLR